MTQAVLDRGVTRRACFAVTMARMAAGGRLVMKRTAR